LGHEAGLAATLPVSLGQGDERIGQHYRPAYGCVLWAEERLLPGLRRRGVMGAETKAAWRAGACGLKNSVA
jgi:hypothetical protein